MVVKKFAQGHTAIGSGKSRVLATEPVFLRPWNGPRVVHEMVSCGMSIKREAI